MKAPTDTVYILKDIEGNVAVDVYWEIKDIVALEKFFRELGAKEVIIKDDELSIQRQRPFVPDPPVVMRKNTQKINWLSIPVIEELLCSREMDDWEKTKKLCQLSGFNIESLPYHRRPEGFISPEHSKITKLYEKWKRENNKTETPNNKGELVRQFAKNHIEEETSKRQKRVQVGTKIYYPREDADGTIKNYDESTGEYYIEWIDKKDEKWLIWVKRKEFEVENDQGHKER